MIRRMASPPELSDVPAASPTRHLTLDDLWRVPLRAAHSFSEHRCTSHGAALAYYAAFSLAPILVIAVSICGMVMGRDAIEGRVVEQLADLVGVEGATLIERMIQATYLSDKKGLAALIGAVAVMVGATGFFAELSFAFERIFERERTYAHAWKAFVMVRLRGLAIVIGVGFMLIISLFASAAIVVVSEHLTGWMMGWVRLASLLQAVLSLAFLTALIAMLFRLLAPIVLPRRELLAGALVTALLFELGKWAIGLYLGASTVGSTFGAAGSLAVLLVWVYYVSLVVLFGAEVTLQIHLARRLPQLAPAPPEPTTAQAVPLTGAAGSPPR